MVHRSEAAMPLKHWSILIAALISAVPAAAAARTPETHGQGPISVSATGRLPGVPPIAAARENSDLAARAEARTATVETADGGLCVLTQDLFGFQTARVLRLAPDGSAAPGWPAAGIDVANAAGDQLITLMTADGAGGVLVCWSD